MGVRPETVPVRCYGVQQHRSVVFGDCPVVLTHTPEAVGSRAVGVCMVRIQPDGLGKVCERLVQCILFNVGLSPVVVGRSVFMPEPVQSLMSETIRPHCLSLANIRPRIMSAAARPGSRPRMISLSAMAISSAPLAKCANPHLRGCVTYPLQNPKFSVRRHIDHLR